MASVLSVLLGGSGAPWAGELAAQTPCPLLVGAGGAAVAGRVTTVAGGPSLPERLSLRRVLPADETLCTVPVDSSGAFTIEGLAPGRYSVAVEGLPIGALFEALPGEPLLVPVALQRPNRLLECVATPECTSPLTAAVPPGATTSESAAILLGLRLGVGIALLNFGRPALFCASAEGAALAALQALYRAVPRADCEPSADALLPPPPSAGDPAPRATFNAPIRYGEERAFELSVRLVGPPGPRQATVRITILTGLSSGIAYDCELQAVGPAWTARTCWHSFDI